MPTTAPEDLAGTEHQVECHFLLDDSTAELWRSHKMLRTKSIRSILEQRLGKLALQALEHPLNHETVK